MEWGGESGGRKINGRPVAERERGRGKETGWMMGESGHGMRREREGRGKGTLRGKWCGLGEEKTARGVYQKKGGLQ